ncbi:hypothetical protein EMIHUDRAFT_418765 [Emiliania huxleyi CCMP1516]|uniref:ABC transporter n=2 Tax=Emiliania huxleyi TaxID=2903 RepID=A0A0D3JRD1_EMIH1|nr:hypothetical protein EMIHUDRAFT_418765 [Emiliania huxleyi CCMP1516]EOD26066.1 hypothetical protein EMIHUDRAFT_418765 [Emiliania huxleyi CCMP1516]|eukprot:XP_005778495.1 hypothetical protein EMIHUDRAFT_418765 [Emiliania huxleyi CCMP1516]
MAIDAEVVLMVAPVVNMLWSAPVQFVIYLVLLGLLIGKALGVGIAVMAFFLFVSKRLLKIRREQLKLTDQRVKVTNELVQGMRVVKLCGWEESMKSRLLAIRSKEMVKIRAGRYITALFSTLLATQLLFVAVGTFGSLLGAVLGTLTGPSTMTALAYLTQLRFPLSFLPFIVIQTLNLRISLTRVNRFLKNKEIGQKTLLPAPAPTAADEAADDAPSSSRAPAKPTLIDLDVELKRGELTMLAGAVGSGKSSLLVALLGEMESDRGASFSLDGSVAYAAQTPFIASDTMRSNILFGSPMDEAWYEKVVEACALSADLEILAGGDMTQIGEKGINVSGGQKARIALARAVYANADIYLLDDPLSAVDAHVGKHLFQRVLGPHGLLAGKTRLLVTHQTQYLPAADEVLLMEAGGILARGAYAELRASAVTSALPALAGLEEDLQLDAAPDSEPDASEGGGEAGGADVGEADGADGGEAGGADGGEADGAGAKGERPSLSEQTIGLRERTVVEIGDARKDDAGAHLSTLEERQTGSISSAVWRAYIAAGGGRGLVLIAAVMCCVDRALVTMTDIWLTYWIEAKWDRHPDDIDFWIPIYVAFAFCASIAVYGRSVFVLVVIGCRAAARLQVQLLDTMLRAPTSFFETTPSGRILNRFTSDTEMCDNTVLMNLQQWINCIMPIASTIVVVSVVNPIFVPWLLVLCVLYVCLYRYSVSRSPIYSQFSETLSGLTTIRSYGAERRFEADAERLVNRNTRSAYAQYLLQAWVSLFLDMMASSIVFCAALLPLVALELGWTIEVALVGLSLTYTFELSQFLKHATRMTLELQKSFAGTARARGGIERIVEYIRHVPAERQGGDAPPAASWPSAGVIVVTNLTVRYRPELPPALRGVSCAIPAKAKVGVVGRTGSGKSTFLSTVWRLIEAEGGADGRGLGAIQIDGVDISRLNLSQLRSRLAIIPQDPVLFNDTVRYNLDPFGTADDDELERVLELVQLADAIRAVEGGLDHKVSEGGANFSVGQRQLLCLARATLRRSSVLALDEATASIDNETDAVLQTAIRQMFAECTVLTIAHRLHTIMDSSHVMLFDAGALAEFDDPHRLLSDPASSFSQLVDKTGSAAPQLRQMARAAHEARAGGRSRLAGLDTDGDGVVDVTELAALTGGDAAAARLAALDSNQDGVLDESELKSTRSAIGAASRL